MAVDDSLLSLKKLEEALCNEYDCVYMNGAAEAFETLKTFTPDLIILDINMPVMDGFEFFKVLKSDPRYAEIAVIFLSGADRDSSEIHALEAGAMDYISKPFKTEFLKKRVLLYVNLAQFQREISEKNIQLENYSTGLQHMVEVKTQQALALKDAIVVSVAEAVENRDLFASGHIKRITEYCKVMGGKCLELSFYSDTVDRDYVKQLVRVVPLHDIGKLEIPDYILLKAGRLTPEEFEVMKTHSQQGYNIMEKIAEQVTEFDELKMAMRVAITHHEKWDGTGYPKGLRGEEIPLEGRIMAIADVYDALISKKSYKEIFSHKKAMEIIASESGKHFDPRLVDVFLRVNSQLEQISLAHV